MKGAFLRIKFLGMLLIVVLLFSISTISVGGQSSTTKLYVNPSKVGYWTPALNKVFMINVTIANAFNLSVFDFELYWNTTLLDLVKVDIQPFFEDSFIATNETREDLGRYALYISNLGAAKYGNGTLVTLSFKITYEPVWPKNVTCALNLADTDLRDPDFRRIVHEVYDGEYSCYSTPPLSLTTMTDKPSYHLSETVHIYGNLTLGSSPVQDGIVAVEVDNPLDQMMVIRSLSTGVPPATPIMEIISVIPCSGPPNYTPKTSFYRGSPAYFNVTIRNNDVKTRWVWIVINLYDVENKPFNIDAIGTAVAAGSTGWLIPEIPIPDTVSVGEARAYANALNKWPRNGGTAYCLEKSATFQILGSGTAGTQTQSSSSSPGTYTLAFKLPPDGEPGMYTIYANSEYTIHEQTQKVTNVVTFGVAGLEGDLDGDGMVYISDLRIVSRAYDSKAIDDPNTPWDETLLWDPRADVAPEGGNGHVYIEDLRVVTRNYGAGTD